MKKIIILLSAFLITLAGCGSSNYSKAVEEIEIYLTDIENDDDENMILYDYGAFSTEEISANNKLLKYTGFDFEIKNGHVFWLANEDEIIFVDIIEYKGNMKDYSEVFEATTYCEIKEDVAFIDYTEELEDLCKDLDGKYHD